MGPIAIEREKTSLLDATTTFVVAVLFCSTLFRSTLGFGDALVAMPLLAMYLDMKLATPLVALVSVVIAVTILAADWRDVHFRTAGWLVAFSAAGIPLGLLLLDAGNERLVKGTLGTVIIVFSAFHLLRPGGIVLQNDRWAWLFGLLAGVFGGAYVMPGPALVVYATLRQWTAAHFRATLQGYFLCATLLIVAGHAAAGHWQWATFRLFIAALPLVFVAVFAGRRLNRVLGQRDFSRYVHAALICLGAALLVQTLAGG